MPHRGVARRGRPHAVRRRGGERYGARRPTAALLPGRLRPARAIAKMLVPKRRRDAEILDDPATDPAVRERSLRDVRRSNVLLGGLRAMLAEIGRLMPSLGSRA